jgi:hypothetical protein
MLYAKFRTWSLLKIIYRGEMGIGQKRMFSTMIKKAKKSFAYNGWNGKIASNIM